MKGVISLVACLFLLAACGPAQTGSGPGSTAEQTQGPLFGSDTNMLRHFWFSYSFPPQPGSRIWINVGATNWVEVYPDGSQSRYRLVGQETVDGLSGVVVAKTAGDVQSSQTLNDGSFEAFLPDRTSTKMIFYFRNALNGQWQPWRPLAEINPIE